jgi:hypothetical protein
MHFDQQAVKTLPHEPKPRPIPGFRITRSVFEAMAPIHRLAAQELIRKGRWKLVDSENSDCAGASDTHRQRTTTGASNVVISIDG